MIKFIVNLGIDLIISYMATLLGAMLYFTFFKNATTYDEHIFLQFIITLLALRCYRAISFIKSHGQSEQI